MPSAADHSRKNAKVLAATLGLFFALALIPPIVQRSLHRCPVRPDGVTEAHAYSSFTRRYGIDCAVCHTSVPQLNEAGYKFRVAGYRMPDEIGNDAKWANWGDNAAVRTQENYVVASAKGATPATNGFSNGGLEVYPLEGAFAKYWAANDEVDVSAGNTATTKGAAGAVSMNNLNMVATKPINADSFLTARVGLISAFQGYGASDRGVGLLSPTFKPTPSQVQPNGTKSFTYPGFGSSGEGLEVAYNWKGTHASAQVVNGYNSFNNSTNQGDDNRSKDFGLYVNQMIGESAIAAYFYSGTTGYGANAATVVNGVGGAELASSPQSATWYDRYERGILYGTLKVLPADKVDLLGGLCDGYDHTYAQNTGNSDATFHSMGGFLTLQSVQHVWSQQLTSALSYGADRASTSTGSNRVSDLTLSLAVPIENNKFGFDIQRRWGQVVNASDTVADVAEVQWQFMY